MNRLLSFDAWRGSFEGSGKLARCVGGGEPDAADMREDDLRGKALAEGVGELMLGGGSAGDGDVGREAGVAEGDGELEKGFGALSIVSSRVEMVKVKQEETCIRG